jgi:hypothetical protein
MLNDLLWMSSKQLVSHLTPPTDASAVPEEADEEFSRFLENRQYVRIRGVKSEQEV